MRNYAVCAECGRKFESKTCEEFGDLPGVGPLCGLCLSEYRICKGCCGHFHKSRLDENGYCLQCVKEGVNLCREGNDTESDADSPWKSW